MISINERGLTSADWTVYNNGTKRLHYSTVPTSDIAAESISCNSYGEQENDSETLNQRYIYRGYLLQVAACDQMRSGHPCLWLMLWDPTQPIATRPLAIRKDGTWYCYGWDLTKNVCEVFGQHGYIRTAYSYTPYGTTTADGDVTQPLQWSSEYSDEELGLAYYNYRHYNPLAGRWMNSDPINEWEGYRYVDNIPTLLTDRLGLAYRIRTNKRDCTINISLEIVIYPQKESNISNADMQDMARRVKESIEEK